MYSMRLNYFTFVLVFFIVVVPSIVISQENDISVLIFSKTNGFRHGSIDAGIAMINEFGEDLNWNVDTTENSSDFNEENLTQYDVVIWLNTSGNNLLTETQQDAFRTYIQNDNGYIGVHAATDTYRDGSWPWYNELAGAIVQTNPNHTANNFNATMSVLNQHPTVEHLGDSWNKDEEYYYWGESNGGYLFEDNITLLEVEQTGNQSYDIARPITWYKEYDGGRSFYTALGHNDSDYSDNEEFKTMMFEAIIWAANGGVLSTDSFEANESLIIYPNPTNDLISISTTIFSQDSQFTASIYDINGKLILSQIITETNHQISIEAYQTGTYIVSLSGKNTNTSTLVIKQ